MENSLRTACVILICIQCLFGCQVTGVLTETEPLPAATKVEIFNPPPTQTFATKPENSTGGTIQRTPTAVELQPTAEVVESTNSSIDLPEPPENRTHYQLVASLDYAAHTLEVDERITYTNRSSETLTSLLLVVEGARYPGSFDLRAVSDSQGQRIFQFRLKDTQLTVGLPAPLLPNESTTIGLAYTLKLVDTDTLLQIRPYPLGYTDLQANFGDWYPFVPPYIDGKGWLAHPPAMFGEHLVYEVADFDVMIRLEGERTDLVLAASSPAVRIDRGYRYQQVASRSFSWSASPFYEVLTRTVDLGSAGPVTIASYHFPLQADAAKILLETIAEAYPLYSRLFGAAPGNYLASVQADFLDGMEYDGLFFLSTDYYNWHKPGTKEDFLIALGAHETVHQWWYKLIGNDQAIDPWLDEAFCTYSEALYFENAAPQALDWWWTWRVDHYEPQGWVDMSIYDAPQIATEWRVYRDPVYLNGAHFIEDLRAAMGDEAFFAGLREYLQVFSYSQASPEAFLDIMKQHSPKDIGDVLKKYLQNQYPN